MKFSLHWLHEHLDTQSNLTTLCEALTMIGFEVEEVSDPRTKLAPFVIAEVVACQKHPEADRLNVCQVLIGDGEPIQVICGAPNARVGMKGVFAAPGTTIPGTGLLLKSGKIRGRESHGMLCSERELEISDEHDGIIDLPIDAPVGMRFADYQGLDDPVIDVALTPNRGDGASVRGIARDLAAAGFGTLKPLSIPEIAADFDSPTHWTIDEDALQHCPQVAGRSFRLKQNLSAPDWMQKRLLQIGLRPISALVDITNYITHEIGRPLHVFDSDKLHGQTLRMRMAKAGETLLCLNGNSYNFTTDDLVIADQQQPVSLAGIMGGEESSCDENTTHVFLEAASFKASSIARTGRRLAIESDARFRFERKVDLNSIDEGIRYASHLIISCCGGTTSEIVWAGNPPEAVASIAFRPAQFATHSGVELPVERMTEILQSLGCTVEKNAEILQVTPPSFRPDLQYEVCLNEEILRVHGYDNVPMCSLPPMPDTTRRTTTPPQRRNSFIRRRLAMCGLDEVINFSFVAGDVAKLLSDAPVPRLANPINAEMAFLRPTPLAGLLQSALLYFERKRSPAAIFQIGPGWIRTPEADQQMAYASVLRLGSEAHWQNAHQGGNDPYAVQADCLAVLQLCGISQPQMRPEAPRHYHPYRSAGLFLGKQPLAYFGNLHPEVIEGMGFKLPKGWGIAACEIFLDNLPPAKVKPTLKPSQQRSDLQPLFRDLSFALPMDYPAGDLLRTIQSTNKKLIADVKIFDVYQEDNVRAVAYRVTIQPQDATLTEAELSALCASIVANVEKKSPACVR